MTDQTVKQASELRHQVEIKDRRFRIAQGVFMAVVCFVLAGVIFFQLRTLHGVQEQLKQQEVLLREQRDNTETLKENTQEQLAKVSNQLDCIARFFAERQRQDARITNLEQCRIVREDGSIIQPDFNQGAAAPDQTPEPRQDPVVIDPNSPGLEPLNPTRPDPEPEPTPPDPEPVEILGIPACVPLTGICITR